MTGRRQYQSCDYCRQRRRKCDAAALGINRLVTNNNLGYHPGVTACRNCAKAGRSCSFLWLIGRKQSRLNAVAENAARQSHHSWSKSPHHGDGAGDSASSMAECFSLQDGLFNESNNDIGDMEMLFLEDFTGADVNDNVIFSSSSDSSSATSGGSLDPIHSISPVENHVLYHQHRNHHHNYQVPISPSSWVADRVQHHHRHISIHSHSATAPGWPEMPLSSAAVRTASSPDPLPSPIFSAANDQLTSRATRSSVTDLLVQVYHKNLEDNLSSWSTALTCPYVSHQSTFSRSMAYVNSRVNSSFYNRVRQMDAMLPGSGLASVPESARVNGRQGSDVLNKVVLAFASQWGGPSALQPGSSHQDLSDSLQEVLHRTLWFDAQRALQNASRSAYSFQTIFARLLFAFIPSPISTVGTDSSVNEHMGEPLALIAPSRNASPIHSGMAIVTNPDCVIQLETALRDLLTWRRWIYGTTCNFVDASHPNFRGQQSFLADFNTLFWLAVMCDTTASVISERPLVIVDDDCTVQMSESQSSSPPSITATPDHVSTPGSDASTQIGGGRSVSVWKAVLTNEVAEPSEPSMLSASNTIEATIEAAIPLKVLLFRRIGILQTLIDRKTAVVPEIDSAMQDVLLVFNQWEAKYGRFMDNCMDKYGTMSRRLRSLHTTLMAHWHYGIMLFARKVEEHNKRVRSQRGHRMDLAWDPVKLARRSADKVARLAQFCLELSRTTPIHAPFEDDNQLTILNEPWCELMVRSLTMTVQILLQSDDHIDDRSGSIAQLGGVQACIEALEELGRYRYKNARDIARSLRLERDGRIAQVV